MIAGNWGSGKLAMAQNFTGFKYVKSLQTPRSFCVIEAEVERQPNLYCFLEDENLLKLQLT